MKKVFSIILAITLVMTQLMIIIPVLASNAENVPNLITKFSVKAYNSGKVGYTNDIGAVADNENFTSAINFVVTDTAKFNNAPAIYKTDNSELMADWLNNADAEIRFWVKISFDLKTTLRFMHSSDYSKITKEIELKASDKWQEIRLKRSDFSDNTLFDATAKKGGTVNLQLLTASGALKQDDAMLISFIEFYDGPLTTEIDPDGGTVDNTPKEGTEIAKFNTIGYLTPSKPYVTSNVTVADNKNFTSAVSLKITDGQAYNNAGGDSVIYGETTADADIKDWAKTAYAELRFWIKVPHEVTFTLRFQHNSSSTGYTSIIHKITIPAGDKWQEIRLKRSDFTLQGSPKQTFEEAVAVDGKINLQILTDKNATDFMTEGEVLHISPISFYNGYISGEIDPDGGTVDNTPKEGTEIAKFNTIGYLNPTKPYVTAEKGIADNKNFTSAVSLKITNGEAYSIAGGDAAIYSETKADADIEGWAKTTYAELRFWIKVPHAVTFTLRLQHNSTATGYTNIAQKITVPASDKWQEIRLKRSDFALQGTPAFTFEDAVKEDGRVYIQILTDKNATDFLAEDETLYVSPISFYDGYIAEDIEPDGGTIIIPDIYGNLINSVPPKVIKAIDGTELQLISVYDNDFVSKALKFTLTDEDVFYEKTTQVNTNGADKPLDLSDWNDYQKAELRFWIKVPHAMKFKLQIVEHIDSRYPYIETTVEIPAGNGWQKIVIPRSEFTSRTDFTGESIQYVRFIPLDGKSSNGYLEFCDSLYMSQVEFFSGIIPDSANKVDTGKVGTVVKTIDLVPYTGNGSETQVVDITDNSNFKKAVAAQIGEVRTFSAGESAHVIHNSDPADLSRWHGNSNAQLRFWVRSAKDVVLQIGLQNPGSNKPSSYRAIWAQVAIKGSDNWQEVRLSTKHFSTTANFDPSVVKYIKIKGTGDDAITTNEIFYVSDFKFYDGTIPIALDTNGGTTGTRKENVIISTFSSFSPKIKSGENVTAELVEVDTNKYFTKSVRFAAVADTNFTATLKTYYDTYDISRGKNGTLRLWVKTASKVSFNIVLTDKGGNQLTLPFSVKSGEKWQELRVNLSNVNTNGFNFTKLFSVSVSGSLKSGTTIQLGKMELWKKTLATEIEDDGGEVAPPPVLPPVWAELPTMGADEENKILITSSNSDFWTGDWNDTSRPRSIVAYNRGLDKKDINYSRFKVYKEISVVNSGVYYKNPTPAMFYLRKVTDITPYLKTGTLRFWINVPKNMSLKVTLQSIDEEGKYSFATVQISLKTTTENNGFSEVQIPLKDFYDAAVAAGAKWNPYFVKNILIGGIDGCSANTFLKEGELLNVSHFEIWKGVALEPEPFDPTRIFYSIHGDIFVKDVEDVLSKTTMLSAYKDTLNFEKYEKIVEKYYTASRLLKAYTIDLLSAGEYNYSVVTAYDEVEVYIPVADGLDTEKLIIAVYNKEGIHNCEFRIEDGYIIVTTKQFGEFLLINGGKRNDVKFDYNADTSEIFGLTAFENAVPVAKKSMTPAIAIIVSVLVVLLCTALVILFIILKKKGIVLRKGKV